MFYNFRRLCNNKLSHLGKMKLLKDKILLPTDKSIVKSSYTCDSTYFFLSI